MIRRILRRLFLAAVVLAAIPVVLTLLYTVVTPVSTRMAWRTVTLQGVTRMPVALGQVARAVPATLIASEDARFCAHRGVDWRELMAVIDNEDGPARGASTLPMQVARNLFLWQGDTGPTAMVRKALEIPLAMLIDGVWTKRRMMEIYLNIAEWGPGGEFGIEAGARRAFRKSAADLGAREAALLVSILPNPIRRSASAPGTGVQRKAAIISRRAGSADTSCL
ncbi:MAG: monofunctional biosynthetic peptidoglycan transglycosylase [Phreatobacter sp.]|uniref:transglycosylase domain-containing protein n=1 Tax=Phreatobacter sp. TaxID=1966341 RepID=UPI001A3F31F7|nr:transglycosylase domain-containing protein [Phreatobacter sp.]MBL8570868.1 monofunctional biosynthetic peptidoglycan transglycosylase [Phreatobacter sp.]